MDVVQLITVPTGTVTLRAEVWKCILGKLREVALSSCAIDRCLMQRRPLAEPRDALECRTSPTSTIHTELLQSYAP